MTLGLFDAGWVVHESKEFEGDETEHPAVVVRVVDGRSLLAHGTSQPRDVRGKKVEEGQLPPRPNDQVYWVDPSTFPPSAGFALQLYKRTYFCIHPLIVIADGQDRDRFRRTGQCPPSLFGILRRIHNIRA